VRRIGGILDACGATQRELEGLSAERIYQRGEGYEETALSIYPKNPGETLVQQELAMP